MTDNPNGVQADESGSMYRFLTFLQTLDVSGFARLIGDVTAAQKAQAAGDQLPMRRVMQTLSLDVMLAQDPDLVRMAGKSIVEAERPPVGITARERLLEIRRGAA